MVHKKGGGQCPFNQCGHQGSLTWGTPVSRDPPLIGPKDSRADGHCSGTHNETDVAGRSVRGSRGVVGEGDLGFGGAEDGGSGARAMGRRQTPAKPMGAG